MGSGSKKQTVGFKYYLGGHLVFFEGHADKLLRIDQIDGDKRLTAWEGVASPGRINVDAPKLFGGEKKQGGVSGALDFEDGSPLQAANDYLAAKLGTLIPAFRGVTAFVLRQMYVGLNPYLKQWSARFTRIHRSSGDVEQWYDAKAEIGWIVSNTLYLVSNDARPGDPRLLGIMSPTADETGVYIFVANSATMGSVTAADVLHRTLDGTETFLRTITPATTGAWANVWSDVPVLVTCSAAHVITVQDQYGSVLLTVTVPEAQENTLNFSYYQRGSRCLVVTQHPTLGSTANVYSVESGIASLALTSSAASPDGAIHEIFPGASCTYVVTTHTVSGVEEANKLICYSLGWSPLWSVDISALHWWAYNADGGEEVCIREESDRVAIIRGNAAWARVSEAGYALLGSIYEPVSPYEFMGGQHLIGSRWYSLDPAENYVATIQLPFEEGTGDMNPSHIVRECLTDPYWGAGYAAADIDDDTFTAAADTLYAEGFGLSILWQQQVAVGEFIDEILRHIDAVRRIDRMTGKWQLKLIRADYDVDDLLLLGEDEIISMEDCSRPQPGELINHLTVIHWDRDTSKDAPLVVHNQALIQQIGREIATTVQYPAITRKALAARVALRDLRALSYPLLSVRLTANRTALQLNIGDPFMLQWPRLGVAAAVMRVTEMSLGDGRNNRISITAVEDVFALPDNVYITTVDGDWTSTVSDAAPAPARLVAEAPYLEIVQELGQASADAELAAVPDAGYLLVAAQRPSDDAINAELQVDAGAGFAEAGTIDFCPVAELAAYIGPLDTTITLTGAVDVEDIAVGSLAQLGDELVRIDAISSTIATIGRGVLDTVPIMHVPGDKLWGIDLYAGSDFTQFLAGESIAVKVLPATGSGELDLAAAPADAITMASRAIRPYAPANVQLNGEHFPAAVFAPLEITWVDRNRLQQTSGSLLDWFDGGLTPEAGQTTTVELWEGATLVESFVGETDGSVTSALSGTRTLTLRAYTVRDGYESWQAVEHTFVYYGGAYLMSEEGEYIATEDATLIDLE